MSKQSARLQVPVISDKYDTKQRMYLIYPPCSCVNNANIMPTIATGHIMTVTNRCDRCDRREPVTPCYH